MATFTKITRPGTTLTKIAKPTSGKEGRFGIARFGSARFGILDIFSKVVRPSTTLTKVVRP